MSSSNSSSPFNNNTEDFDFLTKIRRKFKVDEAKLYQFCEASFQENTNLINYLLEYTQLFRELVFVPGLPKTINKNTKNLFLNILRILNPAGKRHPVVRNAYTTYMIEDCIKPGCVEVLQRGMNTLSSLLLKFIHEKNYERTCIEFIDTIRGAPINKRVIHFVNVEHQSEEKQRELFLQHVTSCLFEEVCVTALDNSDTKVICSVNSPDAGDVLLKNGRSIEIKCSSHDRSRKQMNGSKCLHAAFGMHPPAEAAPPNNGMTAYISLLRRTSLHRNFNFNSTSGLLECILTSRNLQDLDAHVAQAVVLSGIHVPTAMNGGGLDLSCRALVLGVPERQPKGNATLNNCLLFADAGPANHANNDVSPQTRMAEMRRIQHLVNSMYPSPSSGQNNNKSRNEYNRIQNEFENRLNRRGRAYGRKKPGSLKSKGKANKGNSKKGKSKGKSKSKKGKK